MQVGTKLISLFSVLFDVICQQRMWPRFGVSLFTSNNLVKKFPHMSAGHRMLHLILEMVKLKTKISPYR